MPFLDPVLGVKLVYLLGITNIIGILLVFFSCRCMAGARIINRLWKYAWYKKYYAMHCLYWRLFIISVLLHAFLAFYIFGNPL